MCVLVEVSISILTHDCLVIPCDFCDFFLQASMTGSALSLYLEETKTNEDSMFPPEISPIKSEGLRGESKNKSNLNVSIRRRDVPSPGRGDPPDLVSPNPLALHKVAPTLGWTILKQIVKIVNSKNSHDNALVNKSRCKYFILEVYQ